MPIDTKLEVEVLSRFVIARKRKRCVEFASNPKTRHRVFDELRSPAIFDERYVTEISGADRSPEQLPAIFKRLGMGGRVYVMSSDDEWDGQKFQMSYIIGECLAQCIDTLGYCWKTKTAFYEWHHSGTSYFLRRP